LISSDSRRYQLIAKELVAQVEKAIADAVSPSTPVLRAIRRKISLKIKSLDRQIVVEAALALISRNRIHRFIPYEPVHNHRGAMEDITWTEVEQLASLIVREVNRKLETGRKDGRRS
jgi:hypothetical protein